MAARNSAAALLALGDSVKFNTVTTSKTAIKYVFADLMELNNSLHAQLPPELKAVLGSLRILRTLPWNSRWSRLGAKRRRCMRKQKMGKRAGLLTKLRANASRPAVLSLFLSNVRALDNKMDQPRLRSCQREMQHCSVLVLTETWLNNNMPDSVFELDGRLLFRSDRDPQLSGKTRGGGLGILVHKLFCGGQTLF